MDVLQLVQETGETGSGNAEEDRRYLCARDTGEVTRGRNEESKLKSH